MSLENMAILQAPLTIDEIDFRVQSINNGGYATILAYKNARVDMHRLNKAFGVGGWQRKHELINGRLFCSVGIWAGEHQGWAWVQDVGTESTAEKEKGQASDAFKRACFNLGIGIELYDFPLIQVKLFEHEFTPGNGNNKPKATWQLKLKEWEWKLISKPDGTPQALGARDENQKVRFNYGKWPKKEQE